MKSNRISVSFQDDTRAVAPLIGFVVLFGFLIVAFAGYQAEVVPQQNAETEFEHFQQNQNELVELRSAILTAGTGDRPQFPTVKLGTSYRTRILAVNGPPPAGLLRTDGPYPIRISDGTEEVSVDTRFVEYRPGYNEIEIGSTWYENSMLYLDERAAGSGQVIIEDQDLVSDGGTLRITALQNDFQQSGTNRITLELYPTSNASNLSSLDENQELTVELPTRLNSEYWERQFDNEPAVTYEGITDSQYGPSVNELTLTVDSVDNLELNTVGIREEPTEDAVANIDLQNDNPQPPTNPQNPDDNSNTPSCTDPEFVSGNSFSISNNEVCEGNVVLGNNGNINIGNNAEVVGNLEITGNGNIVIGNGALVNGNIIVQQNANGNVGNNAEVTGCVDVGTNNINAAPNADIEFCNA